MLKIPIINFMTSPGKIIEYSPPVGPGVRVDTHLCKDYTVPPFYDSLLAKLIVHGEGFKRICDQRGKDNDPISFRNIK